MDTTQTGVLRINRTTAAHSILCTRAFWAESSEAALYERREDSEVQELRSAMRRCDTDTMCNTLHVTEPLPRGNCVLRWPSQLRHVRKRYLLVSKSRPRLPVSHTRPRMTFRYRRDAHARKHLRFRWNGFTYVEFTMMYEPSEIRCFPVSLAR